MLKKQAWSSTDFVFHLFICCTHTPTQYVIAYNTAINLMPKILFWFRIGKMWKSFWCLLNPGPTGWTWSKPTMYSWLSRFSTPPTSCKPSAEFIVWDKRGQQRFTDSSSKTPWRREFITCFKSKQIIQTTLDQFQFEQMVFLVNWSFIN